MDLVVWKIVSFWPLYTVSDSVVLYLLAFSKSFTIETRPYLGTSPLTVGQGSALQGFTLGREITGPVIVEESHDTLEALLAPTSGGGRLWRMSVQGVVAVHWLLFREAPWNRSRPLSVMGFIMHRLLSASPGIGYQDSHNPYCPVFYLPRQNLALTKLSGRSLRIDFLSHHRRSKFNEYSIWQNSISCTFMLV